ncbi:MAG: hypothetical protein AB7G28_02915 [Pirellulales bacterium]
MQFLAIVAMSILAAVTYGVVHDQLTARVCIEYFTVGHPQILSVPTTSPTVLGFVWGVVATWWVGLGLGVLLAFAARVGARPKKSVHELVRPLLFLMIFAGVLALFAGVAGYIAASNGWIALNDSMVNRVPREQHVPFIADVFAHSMSYAAGAIGGVGLIIRTWRSRRHAPSVTR